MNIDHETARLLRQSRIDAGLLQEDVARVLGVTRWTYARAETGQRSLTSDWLEKLPRKMRRPLARHLKNMLLEQVKELDRLIYPPPQLPRSADPGEPRLTRPTA